MTIVQFQIFECSNANCRLRFPSDLSIQEINTCPLCSSKMIPIGEPFTNFQPPKPKKQSKKPGLFLLLDNLRSTENVGSIFRSANSAAVCHIYCCGTTPTPQHPKVRKASLGAEIDTPWSYHRNSVDLAGELSSSGSKLIALEFTPESNSLFGLTTLQNSTQKWVIIIGNEISGIDPQLIKMADHRLHIPMLGTKSSLNVAVSAGIALYHFINLTNQIIDKD